MNAQYHTTWQFKNRAEDEPVKAKASTTGKKENKADFYRWFWMNVSLKIGIWEYLWNHSMVVVKEMKEFWLILRIEEENNSPFPYDQSLVWLINNRRKGC